MSSNEENGQSLRSRLQSVPHAPGVYLMKDRLGSIIYVGKARDLRKRMANYFAPSRQKMADHKTRALIRSIHDFDTHVVRNEQEAILLEGKLIKDYRPKYNITFRDDKRFLMVRIHLVDPWPKFSLTRLKKDDGARYFGPFAHSGALRVTIQWLNRHFGLRVCRPREPGEKDFRHCHKDVLQNCSAPCMARITGEEYLARVEEACGFLEGKSKLLLQGLEEAMHAAAASLDFEKAAELRDMIESMRATLKPTRMFTRGRGKPVRSVEEGKSDIEELAAWLELERVPRVMECFDISNISDTHCVASMVRFRDGQPDNGNYRRYRIRAVSGQNDFASMSEVVRRRYSRILLAVRSLDPEQANLTQETPLEALRRREEEVSLGEDDLVANVPLHLPDLVIVDGGKGQVSAAHKELTRLGLGDLPLIGLAKEEELVFFPGRTDPVRIPHSQGALRLLQRIRDEAHRWANGYHQLLLKRRVKESILDDIQGLGMNRKQILLKTFGTIAKIKAATEQELAAVKGIGPDMAARVAAFFAGRRSGGGVA